MERTHGVGPVRHDIAGLDEGGGHVTSEDDVARRVRFFGVHDLAAGWYGPRVAELVEQLDPANASSEAMDLIELHNVQQYLENGFFPSDYTDAERAIARSRIGQIRSLVARFFSAIDDASCASLISGVDQEYHADLLELLGRHKAYERCSATTMLQVLEQAGVHMSELLACNRFVAAYDAEVRDQLLASPSNAEHLVRKHLQKDVREAVHLPRSLSQADARDLLERYIDSPDANPNYVGLIESAPVSSDTGVDAKLKLRAKRRNAEMTEKLFENNKGFRTGTEVRLSDEQDEPVKFEMDGACPVRAASAENAAPRDLLRWKNHRTLISCITLVHHSRKSDARATHEESQEMANRLAHATSPYLVQHAENPVDWWEWGPEAFAEAKRCDAPVLLSVGYAACHWCHVMAHESFEDSVTAAYMNDHFVNIKVDREERPDIDAVYMRATQAMTGHGGWPMTCVLTPDGEPFFAGTYFPPEPRQGSPAFTQVLQALADAWENRRVEVLTVSEDVMSHLRSTIDPVGGALGPAELDAAVAELAKQYDADAGGFGTSPKFPPSMVLEFLLRHAERTGSQQSLDLVAGSCEAMARGGMYDQLSGGFARYSVDRFWRVPHFEKMLYDNAQLMRVYLHWWRQSGSLLAERVVRETGRFLLDELMTPEGAFASALDADSDGHEGTFYVWNPNQLMRTLGVDDGAWAAQLLGVTGPGTFERGFSTLQLREDPDDAERWDRVRSTLLDARASRTRPARDDKVVASWNGLAISALAEAGVLLDEPDFTAGALSAARVLSDVHLADGFARTSRNGVAGTNSAVLEDHGSVAEAFIAVLGVTGDPVWLERARTLLDRVVDHFADPDGGFFDTADDAETLVVRPKDASDNAYPSGTSAAVHALINVAAVTGEHRYRAAAESGIGSAAVIATGAPRFAGWTLAAAEAVLAGPLEVAVVGSADERADLHSAALRLASPGAVVVAGDVGLDVPLFEQRELVDGAAAAYVCEGFVCRRPVTTVDELVALVSG